MRIPTVKSCFIAPGRVWSEFVPEEPEVEIGGKRRAGWMVVG